VPSENVTPSPTVDRRTRKRLARRDALLEVAADLVERDGVGGLTMAALGEASDYATASLYTYFPSRSALLAALQRRALATLAEVAEERLAAWDHALTQLRPRPAPRVRSLARLWAFSDLFLSAPDRHPREFRLQQQLLVTPGAEDTADAASVVPAAMVVLDVPRRLLGAAAERGALAAGLPTTDPVGEPLDPTLLRTFAWIVALNGALMVDGLSTGLPSTGPALGNELTGALLRGWGARERDLITARELAHTLDGAPAAPATPGHALASEPARASDRANAADPSGTTPGAHP
jgi:AcrR family transcriptional regulator